MYDRNYATMSINQQLTYQSAEQMKQLLISNYKQQLLSTKKQVTQIYTINFLEE